MKIDKDFAVKVEGRVFTANEISSVSFDIAWFRMNCISENGTKFIVEASLNDVEFLSPAKVPDEDVVKVASKNMWGEVSEKHISLTEVQHMMGKGLHLEPVFSSYTDDVEYITPLKNTSEFGKAVTEALGKLGEATRKFNDAMKIELSIDEKQFAKLIKKYNQDQGRRSGGD